MLICPRPIHKRAKAAATAPTLIRTAIHRPGESTWEARPPDRDSISPADKPNSASLPSIFLVPPAIVFRGSPIGPICDGAPAPILTSPTTPLTLAAEWCSSASPRLTCPPVSSTCWSVLDECRDKWTAST
jgi:hypothetical protein